MGGTLGRLRYALLALVGVVALGTVGYRAFGLSWTDATYQTVTTVATVGFRELHEFSTAEKWFTICIIVMGVSVTLYTFTLAMQAVVEGHLRDFLGRRQMDRKIADMRGHVVMCGWGRVGKAVAHELHRSGQQVVVVDVDPARVADASFPTVIGDATLDETLAAAGIARAHALVAAVDVDPARVADASFPTVIGDATLDETLAAAGIARARALVAAVDGDAENLFVTLSSRALNPQLFIVARARQESSVAKLTNAGADRVVNPQELGAARMASFVARPHVAEFIDVVMHERSMEFRMQEIEIRPDSPFVGASLADILRQRAGVLVLAIRQPDGTFNTNPEPDTVMTPDQVIIAVGTDAALSKLLEVSA